MHPNFWTQEEIEQVLKMRQAGNTYKAIGDVFGCSRQAICDLIFRQPQTIAHREKVAAARAERRALMARMVEEGKTRPQIAAAMGLNVKHVSSVLKKLNLEPRFATSYWTRDRVDQAADLKSRGFSNAHICRVMRISKGTLAGHLFRLRRKGNPDWHEIARLNAEMRHERDADIKRLAEEGKPRNKIADELGLTVKLVSYVCQRLGFKVVKRQLPPKRRISYALGKYGIAANNGSKPCQPRQEETNPADLAIPLSQRKSLLDINFFTCKFPVGDPAKPDFFFCGAVPKEGSPYCAHHHARTHLCEELVMAA